MNRRARVVLRLVALSRRRKSRRRYISQQTYASGGPVMNIYDPPAPPPVLPGILDMIPSDRGRLR